jgi:hypothetical protein
MADEPDPPRRIFGFKLREFVRANRPQREPQPGDAPATSCAKSDQTLEKSIGVRDIAKIAAGAGSPLGTNGPANRENEVHAILRLNLESDKARGWYDVELRKDKKRRRRIRNYLIALFAIDMPLGLIAWFSGHTDPFPFVAAIAGMTIFTARVTWETWFLRTD